MPLFRFYLKVFLRYEIGKIKQALIYLLLKN